MEPSFSAPYAHTRVKAILFLFFFQGSPLHAHKRRAYTTTSTALYTTLVGTGASEWPDGATTRRPTRYGERPEAKRVDGIWISIGTRPYPRRCRPEDDLYSTISTPPQLAATNNDLKNASGCAQPICNGRRPPRVLYINDISLIPIPSSTPLSLHPPLHFSDRTGPPVIM